MPEAISMAGFQSGDKETFNHAFNKQIGFLTAWIANEGVVGNSEILFGILY